MSTTRRMGRAAAWRSPRFFTLVEVMFATVLMSLVVAGMVSFVIMAARRIKAAQSEIMFHHKARYGSEWLTRTVEASRMSVASTDGVTVTIVNPDGSMSLVKYEDADNNASTITNNGIYYYPNADDLTQKRRLIPYVTPLTGTPVFAAVSGALFVRFHVGDSAPVSASDLISGIGYQGVRIRFVAKPRNIGQVWTGGGY